MIVDPEFDSEVWIPPEVEIARVNAAAFDVSPRVPHVQRPNSLVGTANDNNDVCRRGDLKPLAEKQTQAGVFDAPRATGRLAAIEVRLELIVGNGGNGWRIAMTGALPRATRCAEEGVVEFDCLQILEVPMRICRLGAEQTGSEIETRSVKSTGYR